MIYEPAFDILVRIIALSVSEGSDESAHCADPSEPSLLANSKHESG